MTCVAQRKIFITISNVNCFFVSLDKAQNEITWGSPIVKCACDDESSSSLSFLWPIVVLLLMLFGHRSVFSNRMSFFFFFFFLMHDFTEENVTLWMMNCHTSDFFMTCSLTMHEKIDSYTRALSSASGPRWATSWVKVSILIHSRVRQFPWNC